MDFNIYLKDSEVEVLKAVAEAAGESIDTWIRATVIEGLKSDIEHYFGRSKTIMNQSVIAIAAILTLNILHQHSTIVFSD